MGANYQLLPTNAAKSQVYCPFQRDGKMNFSSNYGGEPNYVGSLLKPTRFYQDVKGTVPKARSLHTEHEKWVGEVVTFTSHVTDDDFEQPAALWEVIKKEPGHAQRFYNNVAGHLSKVKNDRLRMEIYRGFTCALCLTIGELTTSTDWFGRIHPDLAHGIRKATMAVMES